MAESKLKMPSGAVLVSVNIPKFKWCFTGSTIKTDSAPSDGELKDLIVKDLSLKTNKPSKWKSIKECIFRVKTLSANSKLATFDLKEGGIFYYHDSMYEDLKESFEDNDEIEVLLFRTYCLGYSYSISSTKATETLKTTCGSISAIGKVPEQTVEFSGYSVKETVENKEELLETYIERSHFITRDVIAKNNGSKKYEIGKRVLPRNYEFFVVFVNQIQSEDQRTKFMVAEGQIATFSPSQDLSNQKIDLKCEVTLSKPLISMSYDYIKDAKFFEI
ncbi:hypothetical protein CNO14_05630 (plasmid) [Borrelia miyamotoi]|uniref:Uncharacterized protein n=4 Tax=Borrelia miyamotoi TaxID=47466 RepID=A0A481YEL6_9SPIR|nr:hypothetical protein [Borrelia miyamotoi]ATQ15455.1 hypothetical protein CNO14_05630 [Borrelia miyamotoi]ATQ16653.1 hypothetical protein CNO13_05735 [Borrelia miyamotoi]ATQ19105.1 hypothetical protein CNO11_06085 [Borrelia miyamotoi]QBK63976.1 hypothetical protein EZU68_06270 [Borrelia miyamotoi]WAZ72854.1 hypothetical protein O5404_07520 [Borrelia miyamotoi]